MALDAQALEKEEGAGRTMNEPKEIIIRGTNWLGDSVITIPAVRALRQNFPSASISMIAPLNLAELWRNEDSVDRVIPFARPTPITEKVRLIRLLRSGHYDLGVLFPNSFESALWFFFGGVHLRIGYATYGRGIILNRKLAEPQEGDHQVFRYLNLVKSLGTFQADTKPTIGIPDNLKRWANNLLREKGIKQGAPIIGINPGSTYGKAKCWPPEKFSGLIKLVKERLDASVIVFGSRGERALAESLCSNSNETVLNMVGETTIMQLAALIGSCDLLISNDTGPMHVACAVGTPLVAILGPTDPVATGPLGESVIIRKVVDCAPCLKRECPTDHRCMNLISADDVYRGVVELLEKS